MPGFRFAETMAGTATLSGEPRQMEFRIEAEAPDLLAHLRSGLAKIRGTVTVAGLCREAPLSGNLWIRLLRIFDKSIRYEFSFPAGDGRRLHFAGQKDVYLRRLPGSMLHLPGEIRDDQGALLGPATLDFPLGTLPAFLASFRPLF